jgi:CHAT domain-containing protein
MRKLIIWLFGIYIICNLACDRVDEKTQLTNTYDKGHLNIDSTLALSELLLDSLAHLAPNDSTYYNTIQSIKKYENQLKLISEGKNVLARVSIMESYYFAHLNKFDKVIACCQYYNLYASKNLDSTFRCLNALQLGNAYERLGDTKKAVATLEDCLSYAYYLQSPPLIAKSATALANSYNQQYAYDKAKEVVYKALTLTDKLQSADKELLQLMNINMMDDELLQIHEIKKALQTAKEYHTLFYLNTYMGSILEEMDASSAIQYYLKSCKVPKQESRKIAKNYLSIANIFYNQKQKDSAFFYLDQGLQLIVSTTNNKIRLLPIFDSLNTENTIYDICMAKSNIILEDTSIEINEIIYAIDNLLAAKKVAELIRKEIIFDESKYQWGIDLKKVSDRLVECYFKLYTITNKNIYAERAFMVIEEAKATALQDNTEHNILANAVADTNYARYIALRKSLNGVEVQLKETTAASAKEKLMAQSNELIMQLGLYNSLSKATTANNEKVKTLEDLDQYLLQNNCNALSYFVGNENVYMLYTNPNSKQIQFAKCDTTIKDSVQVLCDLQSKENIYSTQKNRFIQLSNYVFRTIFGSIVTKTKDKTTLVLADGVLNNLAFDALITDTNKINSFLIKQQKISCAYSIRSLISQQERGFGNGHNVLINAPFTNSNIRNLSQLLSSNAEVTNIAKQFKVNTFTDAQAGFANFQNNLPSNNYIHIASHATAGESPKLEFYDSSVHVNSIYQIPMTQSLAYLNTCQSGSGINYYSEGNLSLGRAFFSNGVHNVVLTFWNMNDASTATISNLFYKNLKQSNNSVTALHEAKLQYLSSQALDKQAPYYWASLQHVGDGNLSKSSLFSNWWRWLIGIALFFLLSIGIYTKTKKNKNLLIKSNYK